MRKASLLGTAILVVLTIGLPAAADPSPSTADDQKVVYTMGSLEDLHSPNPFEATALSDYEALMLSYQMLYGFGQADLSPVSEIAQWPPKHSADGKTWTFKINEGLLFSDGTPLTAHDVAFTYNLINENSLGTYASELGKPIDENAFEAPDDTTLIWHMKEPSMAPESPPWVPILPEHIWSRFQGVDNATVKSYKNIPAIGSGPFTLTEWKTGQYWKFERNPYWSGQQPTVDEIVFRHYQNPEALKLALTNGEIDGADSIPPAMLPSLQADPNITLNLAQSTVWDDLAFNFAGSGDPSLRNLNVRLALAHAIDKQVLVDRVLMGYGIVGDSVVAPTYKRWYQPPAAGTELAYDPEAAKALLDQEGYKDRDGDGKRETPKGDPWSLEVTAVTDWPNSVAEAKLIQGWFRDIGIDTSLKGVSTEKVTDLWSKQDFDMYVWGWGGSPDPNFILSIFLTNQCLWWSDGCYSDPAYDKLYDEQVTEIDSAKRREIVGQMQQYLDENIPDLVLLYPTDIQAYRNDAFTGFVKQPAEDGFIFYAFSAASYLNIKPVAGSTQAGGESSSGGAGVSPWLWLGLLVLVVAVVALVMARRRREAVDKE